ncbi:dephospho-CoA kinase [uncultured Anaerococcus sp.]|uniref:dephospho-CoA kinase n=1 Tax=uncultured Anaerococcus sp. TaxID=293428 RepID=UPI002610441A|nr:dephospho-CoA kinase [uncultured Anaerococcus sp.]
MNPSKIVITGTIASGKSTLSELLENLGYKVLSSDEINRQLLEKGNKNYEAIKSSGQFDQVFRDDQLDKKKLARLIFQDKEKLKILNKLTHKNVLNEINSIIEKSDQKVIFIEIPLYFQMEENFEADEVWLVVADYDTQLQRLVKRDSIDLEYAKAKIETQEDLLRMKKESDVIFDNSTSISRLMEQLKDVLEDKNLL